MKKPDGFNKLCMYIGRAGGINRKKEKTKKMEYLKSKWFLIWQIFRAVNICELSMNISLTQISWVIFHQHKVRMNQLVSKRLREIHLIELEFTLRQMCRCFKKNSLVFINFERPWYSKKEIILGIENEFHNKS